MGYVGQGSAAGPGVTRSQADPGYYGDPSSGYAAPLYASPQQSPFYGVTQAGVDQLQGLQGAYDLYNAGVIDPFNRQSDFNAQLLGQQGIFNDLMTNENAGWAQQQAGWGQQGIDLSRQGLAVQGNALARQMSLLPQQYELQKQGFDITQRSEQQGADLQAYRLNNAAAARGAYTAAGTNVERTGLQQNLQNQFGQLDLQRKDAALTFQERQAQQQDAQKQLDLAGKRLDLSGEELRGRLDHTLASLGIQHQVTADQIAIEAKKIEDGKYSPLEGLISFLMQYANLNLFQAPTG
jgi:hypothetical protein